MSEIHVVGPMSSIYSQPQCLHPQKYDHWTSIGKVSRESGQITVFWLLGASLKHMLRCKLTHKDSPIWVCSHRPPTSIFPKDPCYLFSYICFPWSLDNKPNKFPLLVNKTTLLLWLIFLPTRVVRARAGALPEAWLL